MGIFLFSFETIQGRESGIVYFELSRKISETSDILGDLEDA